MLKLEKNTQGLFTFVQNPANLAFVIPRPLRKESLCKAFVRSTKKKEVQLEFEGMLLSKTEIYLNLLKRLEWRFGIYSQLSSTKDLENKSYLFRYKGKDTFSNHLVFGDKPKPKKVVGPMIPFYNARKYLLNCKNDNRTKMIVKSRILSLCLEKSRRKASANKNTVSFYASSFFGKRARVNPRRRHKDRYKFWLIRNLNSIGVLNAFYLKSWVVNSSKPSKSQENSNGEFSILQLTDYYKYGKSLKSRIRLIQK